MVTLVNELLKRDVEAFGKKAHVVLPKRLEDREVWVLVIDRPPIPMVHWGRKKEFGGKTYVFAELHTTAGTHGLWLEKKKVAGTFTEGD